MAGRGGATFRGVGRRNPRMRRQERGRRKVIRLSKSKHITYKVKAVKKKGGLGCLNGSQRESGGSQVQVCNTPTAFSNPANDTRPLQHAGSVSEPSQKGVVYIMQGLCS